MKKVLLAIVLVATAQTARADTGAKRDAATDMHGIAGVVRLAFVSVDQTQKYARRACNVYLDQIMLEYPKEKGGLIDIFDNTTANRIIRCGKLTARLSPKK